MDLFAYLTKHDGKPEPHGSELVRLARAVGISPFYVYLTARGHKRVSEQRAQAMAANSIGGELDAGQVNTEHG